ncbi:RING-type domain-containing protein [Mycena venus]|uniref:RING-type domain-containing protein n=1 Tax=Mycena venus TaxID=2733690 RepID=A0A8H6XJB6_9AGAR|nr:RING-type domain-containing protein [Mycena venus]
MMDVAIAWQSSLWWDQRDRRRQRTNSCNMPTSLDLNSTDHNPSLAAPPTMSFEYLLPYSLFPPALFLLVFRFHSKICVAFVSFCAIILYAILAGIAVLFGFHILYYNLACEGPFLAGPSNIFNYWPEHIPPRKFSRRRMNHPWNDPEVTRFTGSCLKFFFSLCVPTILLFCVLHQRREYLKACQSAFVKKLLVEHEFIAVQRLCDENRRQLAAKRPSLKCSLCTQLSNRKLGARLFTQPYTLNCGHTFDLECLQRFFRAAPSPDTSGPIDLHQRPKFCPSCAAEIFQPPVPNWLVQSLVDTVAGSSTTRIQVKGDPWEGIFTAPT